MSATQTAPEIQSNTDPAVELNAQSILLVDDSFVLRDRLAMAFQERGFRVAVAGNYDEALAVFRQKPTDLAVLDLRMPGKPGLALLTELKKISPDTKVLILSGFGSIATAIDAIRLGATNFLPSLRTLMTYLMPSRAVVLRSKSQKPKKRFLFQRWLKQNGNTFTACSPIAVATSLKPLAGWEFTGASLQRKLRKRAP